MVESEDISYEIIIQNYTYCNCFRKQFMYRLQLFIFNSDSLFINNTIISLVYFFTVTAIYVN